ncbi:MAG TPA: PorP/SprF family type IX secretion system membrane protein [Pelobium sp.]
MKKLLGYIFFLLTLSQRLSAQDHIYSQFYNAPQYLNPALTGQFDGDFRVNLNYRNQWTNIAGPLNYYSVAADLNVPQFGGGFGLLATKSSEGTAYLKKTNFSAIYAYSVDFGNNGNISFGIEGGLTNRKIDFEKLVFYDQLDDSGIITGGVTSASPPEFNNKYFFDSSAGLNLIIGDLMLGGAVHHLNKPNESFTGTKSQLPMRLNGYLSYKIILDPFDDENSPSITPSVLFYTQAKLQSISAGFQIKKSSVNLGLWYRGDKNQGDALVLSLIFDLFGRRDYDSKIRLGFSHDATSSKLGYGNTAGTTEGALIYETTLFDNYNYNGNRFNSDTRKCYDFY